MQRCAIGMVVALGACGVDGEHAPGALDSDEAAELVVEWGDAERWPDETIGGGVSLPPFAPLDAGPGDAPVDPPTEEEDDAWTVDGAWTCAPQSSCQDVYELEVPEGGARLEVAFGHLTGVSPVRVAIFPPGVPLDGPNALTGTPRDLQCWLPDVGGSAAVEAAEAGVWRVVLGREGRSNPTYTGTYRLTVRADAPIAPLGRVLDDVPSEARDTTCPRR